MSANISARFNLRKRNKIVDLISGHIHKYVQKIYLVRTNIPSGWGIASFFFLFYQIFLVWGGAGRQKKISGKDATLLCYQF